MKTSEKLEWAYFTIKDRLQFGLNEEQAVYARERRVKGVLLDTKEEVKKLEDLLKEAIYLIDKDDRDIGREADFLQNARKNIS